MNHSRGMTEMELKAYFDHGRQIVMKKTDHKAWMAVLTTYFWGMLAHAYGFLHTSFIHDALNAVYADENEVLWKMALGRFFGDVYREWIRGDWAMPWMIGFLSLAFIAMAVKLIADMFDIDSRLGIFLLSGVMVVNRTVTSLIGTYIHDADIDMLALLMAVIAVSCWKEQRKHWLWAGAVCICLSLGLYQAYLSVTVTLMMLYLLYQMQNGAQMNACLKQAGRGCVQIIIGGILYLVCILFVKNMWQVEVFKTDSYNALNKISNPLGNNIWFRNDLGLNWKGRAMEVYLSLKGTIESYGGFYAAGRWEVLLAYVVLVAAIVWMYVALLPQKREKWFVILLLACLPIAMNIAGTLSGFSHSLMEYAFLFVELCVLIMLRLISTEAGHRKRTVYLRYAMLILSLMMLWNGVISANRTYFNRDLADKARLSYMTRILYRLEQEPGFSEAESFAVIGSAEGMRNGKWEVSYLHNGQEKCFEYDTFGAYCRYILKYGVPYCDPGKIRELADDPVVRAMPAYPAEGCVRNMDGVFVVKADNIR